MVMKGALLGLPPNAAADLARIVTKKHTDANVHAQYNWSSMAPATVNLFLGSSTQPTKKVNDAWRYMLRNRAGDWRAALGDITQASASRPPPPPPPPPPVEIREQALKEKEQLLQERELALQRERDDACHERDDARRERDTARRECDDARRERDRARRECGDACCERDTALLERDAAREERDSARSECARRERCGESATKRAASEACCGAPATKRAASVTPRCRSALEKQKPVIRIYEDMDDVPGFLDKAAVIDISDLPVQSNNSILDFFPLAQQDHITVVTAADEEIDVIYIPEVEWNASKERFLSFARPRMTVEFVVDS